MGGGSRGERCRGAVPAAELRAVAVCLLEVVAEDLLELGRRVLRALEPAAKRSCSSARASFGIAS